MDSMTFDYRVRFRLMNDKLYHQNIKQITLLRWRLLSKNQLLWMFSYIFDIVNVWKFILETIPNGFKIPLVSNIDEKSDIVGMI